MRRPRSLILGLVVAFLALAVGEQAVHGEAKLSADDYAIFNCVVKQAFEKSKFDQIVLFDHTSAGYPPGMAAMTSFGIRDKAFAEAFTPEMRKNFDGDNKMQLALEKEQVACPKKCVFIDGKTLDTIFGKKGPQWEDYYKRFPGSQGVTFISRPAYNGGRDVAIVYFATSSDMLAGVGRLYLLDKKAEGWTIRSFQTVWVS